MYAPIKRLIDILISFIALVVLSPILLIVILFLLFTGEREVFFLQKRIGFKNREFNIWKFATMIKNSPNIGTGEITLRNDPRVTIVGKYLRITKINELPQIINVFLGDMSVVGARPLMKKSFELYSEDVKKKIYNTKPGITGVGSIIFRDEERLISESNNIQETYRQIFQYKGELEMWYQKNISPYTDCMVMFLTAWSVIFPKNNLVKKIFKTLPVRDF